MTSLSLNRDRGNKIGTSTTATTARVLSSESTYDREIKIPLTSQI